MIMHRGCCLLAAGLAWLFAIAPALAAPRSGGDDIVSPERIPGVHNVDAEGLIGLYISTPGLVLIDSRINADRRQGYIEGSISLPDTVTDCDTLATVAPAPQIPLLFYCNGVRCGRSARAARIAVDCGYSDVYWYRNGIEVWRRKEYPLVQ